MMLRRNALALMLFWTSGDAFINRKVFSVPRGFTLNASPYLPPPPLPPPPPQSVSTNYGPDFLSQLFRDLQHAIENFQLTVVSAMKEQTGFQMLDFQLSDLSSLLEETSTLKAQLTSYDADLLQQIKRMSTDVQALLVADHSKNQPAIQQGLKMLQPLTQSPTLTLVASAVLSYFVINSALSSRQAPPPSQPYPMNKYDPIAARAYFDKRLPMVVARSLEIAFKSLQFALSLASDKFQGKLAANEMQRGRELAALLTRLGPTFIKVGQSLSIRTDVLSPAYIRGLETLQDQVPAFSTAVARQILESEWGQPVMAVLMDDLTLEPVAAASLGQVYKAKLLSTGEEVAIKVQRPDIMEKIALDMHLLRDFGAGIRRLANLNTDTVATVDVWGTGFVDELDYIQEAANGEMFSTQIKETPLKDVVFAPSIVKDYSTRSVLVTSWVNGERLDRSSSEDVSILCSIAMNTYLTMLLELGLLRKSR